MRLKLCFLFLALTCLAASASAMDRWSALSMLESGNNDYAVGRAGEISRFQILPELWPGGNPRNAYSALKAAQEIMQARLNNFQATHRRPATDFEFYILWNAPMELNHPSAVVTRRAWRFANLVQRA